jgi:O-antigen/teichoic acid export membrane protein
MANKTSIKYYRNSFIWGVIAKLLDAGIKFLTIPILLNYFGKDNYGLLTLAIATNAYMLLLDMGMNTGTVKFYSQWIASGKYDLLHRVAQTNITFYLFISIINSIVLILIGKWGIDIFRISPEQYTTFQNLIYILASFSIINWLNFVFNQLLIADEKIAFTQQIGSVRSILGLMAIGVTILFELSLVRYFFLYLLANSIIIIPYLYLCIRRKLIISILPSFFWKDFAIVFKYSLAILAMSLFQFTAMQSRPLILGIFSNEGVGILTEYRILEVFPLFIISIGGMFTSIFLPKTSKAIQNNDKAIIERMAYEGTKYTSIIVSMLCFPVMLNAHELLILYVGVEYNHLAMWLCLWILTIIFFLHNTPIASLVLATGKTKMLVYSSAIACTLSIIINVLLTNKYGVGSAIIGYLFYIIIQMSFYYFYFNNKVLGLKSLKVLKSFILPTGIGFILFGVIYFLKIKMNSLTLQIFINSGIWTGLYLFCLKLLNVIDIISIKKIIK